MSETDEAYEYDLSYPGEYSDVEAEAHGFTALATVEAAPAPALSVRTFSDTQLDLIKRTVANGTSDDEFALFIEVAKRSGLDPFMHQIYAVMRWDGASKRNKMTIQTGIDGFAAIADRTGVLAGVDRPEFTYDVGGRLESAIARVWKLVGGQRVPFEAEAYWDEYVQTNKDGNPTRMWKRMPRTMLSKCALAKAFRVGFPSQLGGLYTNEEMDQADNDPTPATDIHNHRPEKPASAPDRPQAPQQPRPSPASQPAPARPQSGPSKSAPANARSTNAVGPDFPTTTSSGYNPLSDVALRKRLTALGYRTVTQVEMFLDGVRGDGEYTENAIKAALQLVEAQANAAAARGFDLHELSTGARPN